MSPLYDNIKCPVCKRIVEQSGNGRPAEYHKECRRFVQLFGWLENEIHEGKVERTPEMKKYIKSNLTRLGNLTNNWK
jgi:hypothetical protein